MAFTNVETHVGIFLAAEDLSDHQYRAVQLNGLNGFPMWQKPSAIGTGLPQGILTNDPGIGQEAQVQIYGISKAILGGTADIQAGRPVGILEDGSIIEGGSFATTVDNGSPGDVVSILLGGAGSAESTFSYSETPLNSPVHVPLGQDMNVHGCQICINGPLYLDGDLYLEE